MNVKNNDGFSGDFVCDVIDGICCPWWRQDIGTKGSAEHFHIKEMLRRASSPSTKEYTPSKDAKSLSKDAPTTGTGAAASAAAKSSSPWGGMMRNIGLLAGGMMLGSLLGSMFGMGSGLFADILGMLMNVVLIGAVFMIGRLLWNKLRDAIQVQARTVSESGVSGASG